MPQGNVRFSFASFFSGIGCFDLAFVRAGWTNVYACELDDYCRAVYAARFGHEPQGRNIRDVRPEDVPDADCWVAGPPCQDLSTAGKRAGLVGERSGLFHELLRLVGACRPRFVLLEQVPGLLSSHRGRDMETWVGALARLGYVGAYRVLDARFFGVAQRRRRVFTLGGLGALGTRCVEVLFEPEGGGGNPAESGEAGAGVAARIEDGVAGTLGGGSWSRGWCNDTKCVSQRENDGTLVVSSLTAGPGRGDAIEEGSKLVVANAVSASAGHHGHSSPRGDGSDNLVVASPIAFDAAQITSAANRTRCEPGRENGTLASTGRPMVVQPVVPIDLRQASRGEKVTNNRTDGGPPGVGVGDENDPAFTVSERGQAVAYHVNAAGSCAKKDHAIESDHARCLDQTGGFASGQGGTVVGQTIAFAQNQRDEVRDLGDQSGCIQAEPGMKQQTFVAHVATTLRGFGHGWQGQHNDDAARMMLVRRLSPTECERLQGLPDDWTLIEYRGKPAADSMRYRAIGNGGAVPLVEWIARRLGVVQKER